MPTLLPTSGFVRSQGDTKNYLLFTLDNGLEVMLVADNRRIQPEESDQEALSDEEFEEESDPETRSSTSAGSRSSAEADQRKGFVGCAAAMAVGAGSFHEEFGKHPHGLAHLLEHMLFMGSEKYPSENAYDNHLAKHGGFSNAFTEAECTVFCTFLVSGLGTFQ